MNDARALNLHPPRAIRVLWLALAVAGAVGLSLLAVASANSSLFLRHYNLLLILNSAVVIVLMLAVGYQIWQIRRARKERVFGAKLTTRLVAFFAAMAILPGILLYLVSSQFLSSSIESWADVKIDAGLSAGLALAQTLIKENESDAVASTRSIAAKYLNGATAISPEALAQIRIDAHATVAAIVAENGAVVEAESEQGIPKLDALTLDWATFTAQSPGVLTETTASGVLAARTVVPIAGSSPKHALVLWFALPKDIRDKSELVNSAYVSYGNFISSRAFLKQLYGSTLTLALLLAIFSALAVAMVLSERFALPLARLAEGTREVAAGNYDAKQPVETRDELGVLTQSFNTMTEQLSDAKTREATSRKQIETSNAYLESVLRNLSAGVLVFDSRFRLKVANTSAAVILQAPLESLREEFLGEWGDKLPALYGFAELLKRGFAASRDGAWQRQSELMIGGNARTLLVRGTRLPGDTDGGTIVVFDDVSEVIQAQRDTAWAEVARRLAHEIKNPLTPIQLSAERLQLKLADALPEAQANILTRATGTIVSQVTAMKEMVNDFATYARRPKPGSMQPLSVESVLRDVVALYEAQHQGGSQVQLNWRADASMVAAEATRLRQVFHNLLQNAMDAVNERGDTGFVPEVVVHATRENDELVLAFEDNGPGFAENVRARAFEPYVTSKAKGTGLGLAIVKKIVDEHHGRIEIQNRKGGGARVVIRLPLSTEHLQTELLHAN